jgi:hypothetical protein
MGTWTPLNLKFISFKVNTIPMLIWSRKEKGDVIQAPKDSLEVPVGPVTRLRAKRFKEAFNDFFKIHGLRWTSRGY